jgi:transposase
MSRNHAAQRNHPLHQFLLKSSGIPTLNVRENTGSNQQDLVLLVPGGLRMSLPASPTSYRVFVGIDIAAATATVVTMTGGTPGRPSTIKNTPQGYAALQQQLRATGCVPADVLVVMEATGSYWIALATTLALAGFAVSVINPAQAHHFAKALLKRAKTDAIDAQTLARLAALLQPAPWTPPPAIYYELQQRLAQRDALQDVQRQVQNQLHALEQGPVIVAAVKARMETLIATLGSQIAEVDAELASAINQDAEWAAAAARLQTIVGIGVLTAAWLLVTTLNFTSCATADEATAYAGLAPHPTSPARVCAGVRRLAIRGTAGYGRHSTWRR